MTLRGALLALVTTVIAMQAIPASAGAADDPRDAKRSPFDLKKLESSWERSDGHVLYDIRVTTWRRWNLRDLDCELPVCALSADFDTKDSRRTDFILLFKRDGRDLVADLIQLRPREVVATLSAAKLPKGAFIIVPKRLFDADKRIGWSVFSQSGGITDEAPDTGRIPIR